jgi:hypothetical protein
VAGRNGNCSALTGNCFSLPGIHSAKREFGISPAIPGEQPHNARNQDKGEHPHARDILRLHGIFRDGGSTGLGRMMRIDGIRMEDQANRTKHGFDFTFAIRIKWCFFPCKNQ